MQGSSSDSDESSESAERERSSSSRSDSDSRGAAGEDPSQGVWGQQQMEDAEDEADVLMAELMTSAEGRQALQEALDLEEEEEEGGEQPGGQGRGAAAAVGANRYACGCGSVLRSSA